MFRQPKRRFVFISREQFKTARSFLLEIEMDGQIRKRKQLCVSG